MAHLPTNLPKLPYHTLLPRVSSRARALCFLSAQITGARILNNRQRFPHQIQLSQEFDPYPQLSGVVPKVASIARSRAAGLPFVNRCSRRSATRGSDCHGSLLNVAESRLQVALMVRFWRSCRRSFAVSK